MSYRSLPEMPCGPILELNGQRKRFHIPFGLKPLLENMTREALREQPENIFDFFAVYLENRLRRKQDEEEKRKGDKSWKQHRWSWEGTSVLPEEELQVFLEEFHTVVEEANHHALVIQTVYRGYLARKKVKDIKRSKEGGGPQQEEEGAGGDGEKQKSWEAHRFSSEGTSVLPPEQLEEFLQVLEQEHNLKKDEIEVKAVKIQAALRGYLARKKVKEIIKSKDGTEDLEVQPSENPDGSGGTDAPEGEETKQDDAASSDPSPPPPDEVEGTHPSSSTAAAPEATEAPEAPEESHAEESEPIPAASETDAEAAAPPAD